MSATPAAPAAPAATPPAPAAPAVPGKLVTPPLPKGQAESAPKPTGPAPLATVTPRGTPTPPESLSQSLSKLSKEVFEPKATPPAGDPPAPAAGTPAAPAAPAGDPPTPEPPAGTDHFAHIKEPTGIGEIQAQGWKALKREASEKITAAEKKLTDAMAELTTLKNATPADTADLARLRGELQAAHDRLAVLDVQSHPDFVRQYAGPKKKALEDAQSLLTDNAVEGAHDVAGLLAKPRNEFSKVISELAGKMPVYDQAAFTTAMREAYRLHTEEKGALSKSGELAQQLQAKSAQQQRQAFEATWKEFDGKVKPRPMPENATAEERAEVQAFNDGLAALKATAEKNVFGKLDDKGVASMGAKAAALDFMAQQVLPHMDREFAKAAALIKELTSELAAIKGRKAPGSFTAPAGEPAAVDTSKMTISQLSKHVFGGGSPPQA